MPNVKRHPRRNEIVDAASGVFGMRPPSLCTAEGMGFVSSELWGAVARRRSTSSGPSKEETSLGGSMAARL